jgi:hypothetical protein
MAGKMVFVVIHDWGSDYATEVCETFDAAQASMRSIASEHFSDDGERCAEVLTEIDEMTGTEDAGVTLAEGEVTIDMRVVETRR